MTIWKNIKAEKLYSVSFVLKVSRIWCNVIKTFTLACKKRAYYPQVNCRYTLCRTSLVNAEIAIKIIFNAPQIDNCVYIDLVKMGDSSHTIFNASSHSHINDKPDLNINSVYRTLTAVWHRYSPSLPFSILLKFVTLYSYNFFHVRILFNFYNCKSKTSKTDKKKYEINPELTKRRMSSS